MDKQLDPEMEVAAKKIIQMLFEQSRSIFEKVFDDIWREYKLYGKNFTLEEINKLVEEAFNENNNSTNNSK